MRPDDSGAAFPFGFSLFGHGPFHVRRELDVLDFDGGDVNAPVNGFFVHNGLDFVGNFLPFGEQSIKFNATDDIAQCSLGVLSDGIGVILNF